MNKKTGLQVGMVLIIIIMSLWFYMKYFSKKFENVKETKIIEKINENGKKYPVEESKGKSVKYTEFNED